MVNNPETGHLTRNPVTSTMVNYHEPGTNKG